MIGEDKTNGIAFQNINCYSSTNLVEWQFENALLTLQPTGDLGSNRIVERPKVIYNDPTQQYVMWMHIDNSSYGEAKVGVATCDTVCGDYDYLGSFQPLGNQSRDIGLFQDDDGSAYLLSEDRPNGLHIYQLNEDYLNVTSNVHLFPPPNVEAPAMVKLNGIYYIFGSHLTGWTPNDNVYSTATSLSGPWSSWADFAPAGTDTFTSQTNYILPVTDDLIMYAGDRWVSTLLMRSTYVWLPLSIDATNVTMAWYDHWTLDAETGVWAVPGPAESSYEGADATLSNGARVLSCSGCSGGEDAGYIGGPSNGTALFSNITGASSGIMTVTIMYANGDSTSRYAEVSVNGNPGQVIAFLPTDNGQSPGASVANLELEAGTNSITIAGVDGGWGPDLDLLLVPVS